jgi:hypothetical protein
MTGLLAWMGVAAVLVAACASQPPQGQPADSAAMAQPARPAETAAAAPDTLRRATVRPPERPLDARPWVPRTDTMRIKDDAPSAGAAGQAQAPGAPRAAAAPSGEWTAGVTEVPRGSARPATLRAVRTARNEGWDRVVFEFDGAAVPGYRVEYVDRPVTRCGSGHETQVAGQGWLEVRITPAQAHTEAGRVTVAERERKLALPVLRELEQTCDFEGDVTWVLGVASPNRYRVSELTGPARLVVDVRH